MRWLENRPPHRPPVHGIAAYKNSMHETRSWQLRVPTETTRLIIDTPAGIESTQLHELVYDADNVLIPIMPSPIDMRYAVKFIADLILVTQIERGNRKLGIVANRTRANTHSLRKLMRFLSSLNIPLVTVLRDSQNFVHAAERGLGVYEMPYYKAHRDIADLSKAVRWLEKWQTKHQRAMAIAKSETDELPARPLH
jgi:chromosome partitioning protein